MSKSPAWLLRGASIPGKLCSAVDVCGVIRGGKEGSAMLANGVLDNQITISVTVEQIISWIIIGLIAGLLASLFARGRVSLFGLLFVGLLGAVVGGFLFFDVLDLEVTGDLAGGILIRWIDILVAFIGALIILAVTSAFYWRRF
jgi:uncharacterized membrane protein YeaQ/YmgE (transglycosylase-associated protein family)